MFRCLGFRALTGLSELAQLLSLGHGCSRTLSGWAVRVKMPVCRQVCTPNPGQDQRRGCRRSHVPPQPPTPVSPGRAWATWTDGTRGPWGSAGVTGHPGPHHPGTCGRCCLPPPCPPTPSPRLPAQSIFPLQGPPGVKGEKGDHGHPGLQVRLHWGRKGRVLGTEPPPLGWTSAPAWPITSVLFQGHPGLQGTPGKVGVQGPKVGEKPGWRVLRWRQRGLPSLPHPGPHRPAFCMAWPVGRGVSVHTDWGQVRSLPRAGPGPEMGQLQPGTGMYPPQLWVLGVIMGGAGRSPCSAPTHPSFALRE